MGKTAIVGHLCVDLRPHLPVPPTLEPGTLMQVGPLAIGLGGAVANTGRVLARLGHPVVGWGAVGPDDLGAIVRSRLAGLPGFDFRPVPVPAGTSYTIVVEPPGTDRVFWHHPGSNGELDLAGVAVDGVELLHFGYPSLLPGVCADAGSALQALFGRAAATGVVTSLDLAWVDPGSPAAAVDWPALLRRILPLTDILSPSYDDLACIFDLPTRYDAATAADLVDLLLEWGAGVVMITAGADGLVLGSGGARRLERLSACGADTAGWAGVRLAVPARQLSRQATTTGAGDAATAGLLAGLRSGCGPLGAAELAVQVAAAVIEQGGTGEFAGL